MQGQRPPERTAEGCLGVCQAVLTGSQAHRLARSLDRRITIGRDETKRRPHLWDRGGFDGYGASDRGSLTREIGRAAMERIDGASTVFPVFCAGN